MPSSTEAAFLKGLFERAREAMDGASASGRFPPRFVMEGGRSMARHMGITEPRLAELLPAASLYQYFLPSVLAADTSNFTQIESRLPESFALIRDKFSELESHPQLVILTFHMSGLPLLLALTNGAYRQLRSGPCHVMVAPRNMGWLAVENGRWVREACKVIVANSAGLRRLVTGLRDGSIERLGALVDGPDAPGNPGTRALSGISPTLGFRTGLLSHILSMGIPVLPVLHYWRCERLAIEFGPLLTSPADGIDAVAGIIECILRRHPEQWLNWTAARLRT
jgi:hypothetical protein